KQSSHALNSNKSFFITLYYLPIHGFLACSLYVTYIRLAYYKSACFFDQVSKDLSDPLQLL
ncbi:MAG TPA: hypothetical protein PKC41_10850, partial [Chitinophagaceae bacterium]|nr:hypothetical protein [Chitinophagaceae bacterium]